MQTLTLGEKVRKRREEMEISLRELARRMDVSPSFVSDVESGRRYPRAARLKALAKVLGVPVSELTELDHRPSLQDLKRLLDREPAWGPAFRCLYSAAADGSLTPAALMEKITAAK